LGCQSSSATGIATRALKIVGGDVSAGDVLHRLARILRVSTVQRGSQIRVRNQIRASNKLLNAAMPCSVISTGRPCGRRRIQSRSKAGSASDAPTRPSHGVSSQRFDGDRTVHDIDSSIAVELNPQNHR
jgi:hypothetical protein